MSISWTVTMASSVIACMVWICVTIIFYPEFVASMINNLFVLIKDIRSEHELLIFSSLISIIIYGLAPIFVIIFVKILYSGFRVAIFTVQHTSLLSHNEKSVDHEWMKIKQINKESGNIILKIVNKYSKHHILKSHERVKAEKTRYVLAVVSFQENKCIIQNSTNPQIQLKVYAGIFFSEQQTIGIASIVPHYFQYVQNNEIILIEDNGIQFNLIRKNHEKFELFRGYSLLSYEYYKWEKFIHDCSHLDVENEFLRRLGRYAKSHKNHNYAWQIIEKQLLGKNIKEN